MIRNVQITKKRGGALILEEIASEEFVQWAIINGCGARWRQRADDTNITKITSLFTYEHQIVRVIRNVKLMKTDLTNDSVI